jgi:hypothetical protein
LSGFADFGSFFSPAAAQKFPPAAGSGQSLFHFFASGGQSLFQKKRLRRAPGNHFSIFSPPAVNHFSKKIACGELRSITFSFFHVRGQSLFQKIAFGGFGQSLFHFFTSGGFSATHFSIFHLRRSITFPHFFASGGFSVNHFSIFSPPADFQLSIFKV